MAAAEAAPSASWAFFCAASDDDDVEPNRRGALAWRRARNVVDCITFFALFLESKGFYKLAPLLKEFGASVGE